MLVFAAIALVGAANLDVTTKQGVNFEVSTHRIPLYLKALQFVDRSTQYQQIADEVTRGAASDADRVLRLFEWTRRRIQTTPQGWPVVDDHILNIIIRGHGLNDQQADVFTTLSTYAGVPAFWANVPPDRDRANVILSFALVDGSWRVFDVFHGVVFRTETGQFATLTELKQRKELVPPPIRAIDVGGIPYVDVITRETPPPVPDPLRAELQMPLARLRHEVWRASTRLF